MSATITISPTTTEELPCTTISSRSKPEKVGSSADHVYGRVTETIVFDDCPTGLGIKIVGGAAEEDDERDYGIFIKRVLFGGLAAVDGRLQEGDEVLEVNGDSLSGLTNDEAVHLLRQAAASNYFRFVVTRDDKAKSDFEDCLETHGAVSCSTSSVADQVSVCSQSSSKSPRDPESRNWSALSPGGQTPPVTTGSPPATTPGSRSNTPLQAPAPPTLGEPSRFPGECPSDESDLEPAERYSPPPASGYSSPSLSEIEACVSAASAAPLPTPLPAYGASLPKVSNATAAAFPLQRGPLLKPSLASTPQAGGKAGFLISKSSTPQATEFLNFSPGGDNSVFEPSPVASCDNPSHIIPGANGFTDNTTRPSVDYDGEIYVDEANGSVMSQEQQLSLDPNVKLKVEKLETALRYLGLDPTAEQQQELRNRVHIDSSGTVIYGDFVRVAGDIFKQQLKDRPIRPDHPFMMHSESIFLHKSGHGDSPQNVSAILAERESMKSEIIKLQNALREKDRNCRLAEEELLRVRQEAQHTIIHNRSLQSKVHLVEQAQRASRGMEQDYEEVVRLLEAEVGELKARENKIMDHPDVQKRIAILSCQLRKAELSKKTYEVATEKLLQFVESIHEVLTGQGDGFSFKDQTRSEPGRGPRPPGYLGKTKRHTPHTLAVEARDVVKTVQSLIEVEPLPFGWDEAYTEDGVKYYINHVTQVTSWVHPLSNVEHTSSSRPVSSHGRPPPPMPPARQLDIAETRT